ncbi:hypothetical protein CDAR_457421 [Caerostris darwini]|uniref:Uncharacterized protein n=1 Tax=Caerostris darwini TaxID=1538125 RepID=A0AAV4PDE5_9ARAC|nr:hypothetical protein CDAR_457421 [Caerostris darwini]
MVNRRRTAATFGVLSPINRVCSEATGLFKSTYLTLDCFSGFTGRQSHPRFPFGRWQPTAPTPDPVIGIISRKKHFEKTESHPLGAGKAKAPLA